MDKKYDTGRDVYQLILLRHGESTWNKENRFTGWTDVDLTDKGAHEAHEAARQLKKAEYDFDIVYTSVLKRSIQTVWIVLEHLDRMCCRSKNPGGLTSAIMALCRVSTKLKLLTNTVKTWFLNGGAVTLFARQH